MRHSRELGRGPDSIEEMAAGRRRVRQGARPYRVDVLGFSLEASSHDAGLAETETVRRLMLVGTGPRSGEGMATLTPEAQEIFGSTYEEPDNLWLRVHFSPSERSQAAGRDFLQAVPAAGARVAIRRSARRLPRHSWKHSGNGARRRENPYEYLKKLTQPTLIVKRRRRCDHLHGEFAHPQQNIPNAQLILYPDAHHGSNTNIPRSRPSRLDVPLRGKTSRNAPKEHHDNEGPSARRRRRETVSNKDIRQ